MWAGFLIEEWIMPKIRHPTLSYVYLMVFLRAILALRVLRVAHLTKRSRSMKVRPYTRILISWWWWRLRCWRWMMMRCWRRWWGVDNVMMVRRWQWCTGVDDDEVLMTMMLLGDDAVNPSELQGDGPVDGVRVHGHIGVRQRGLHLWDPVLYPRFPRCPPGHLVGCHHTHYCRVRVGFV